MLNISSVSAKKNKSFRMNALWNAFRKYESCKNNKCVSEISHASSFLKKHSKK